MPIFEAITQMTFWKTSKDSGNSLWRKFEGRVSEFLSTHKGCMIFPPYDLEIHRNLCLSGDPVRYGAIALAITRIKRENIAGSFAEVGVYKGETSKLIHALEPERKLYLFDSFEGFAEKDLDPNLSTENQMFKDTGEEFVRKRLGDTNNVIIRKGWFPDTAKGLENESFSFVMLDVDKYTPTLAALEFFYPRTQPGGYVFIHDYNTPGSDYAVLKAVDRFMEKKPEKLVEIPDRSGSVIIRKI